MSDNITELCSLEDLERNGFLMYQLKEGFRFGTDTALLAWFAACFVRSGGKGNTSMVTKKKTEALELGAGCGACSLLLMARQASVCVDAVEIMEKPCEVIGANVKLNHLEGRLRPIRADIRELPPEVKNKQYDIVFMNPPFFREEKGTRASEDKSVERLNGRFEQNGDLDDFVRIASARVIPSSGHVVMIMKGNRLKDCLKAFEDNQIAPVKLMTVHSFADKEASMILLAGKRGSKDPDLRILPPLILNERLENGEVRPTSVVEDIYNKPHTQCFI